MTYQPISTAGAKLYISSTPTGSPTLEIKGVLKMFPVGPEAQGNDRTTMPDTSRVKGKSALSDSGKGEISGLWSNQDAGQQMLKTAQASSAAYNFKWVPNDASALGLTNNTTIAFSALVMSFKTAPAGADGKDITFASQLDISGSITETLPS
jgi:hypothetical protein